MIEDNKKTTDNNKENIEGLITEPTLQYLVFKIDKDEYALDVLSVQEIVGVTNITKVPGSPGYMTGLINLRGNILHVVDLRARLHIKRGETHKITDDVIIVISTPNRRFGILVDMVTDVIDVYKSHVSEAPIEHSSGVQISHVIRIEQRVIMALNVSDLVKTDDELINKI